MVGAYINSEDKTNKLVNCLFIVIPCLGGVHHLYNVDVTYRAK